MAEDDRKSALTAELAAARARLTTNVQALRHDLDFPARAKRAFARQPAVWIGGAALLGLIIAKLPARTKKVVIDRKGREAQMAQTGKAALVLGALKIAFDFARPALTKWVTQRFTDYVSATHSSPRSRA